MNILKQIKELINKHTNDQELGSVVRHKYKDKELYQDQGDGTLIYESPDNGNTVYSREFGKEEKTLVDTKSLWVCEICNENTYEVDLDYIGNNYNHLGCELKSQGM